MASYAPVLSKGESFTLKVLVRLVSVMRLSDTNIQLLFWATSDGHLEMSCKLDQLCIFMEGRGIICYTCLLVVFQEKCSCASYQNRWYLLWSREQKHLRRPFPEHRLLCFFLNDCHWQLLFCVWSFTWNTWLKWPDFHQTFQDLYKYLGLIPVTNLNWSV